MQADLCLNCMTATTDLPRMSSEGRPIPHAWPCAVAVAFALAIVRGGSALPPEVGIPASPSDALRSLRPTPDTPAFRLAYWEAMPGPMRLPVFDAVAVEIRDQLVVLGGFTDRMEATRAIQIRHPIDGWLPVGSALIEPRARATLIPLARHRVLILGGYSGVWSQDARALDNGEILDPLVAGSARLIESFGVPLEGHTATPLPDGRIAVACGCDLRLFDPASETWSAPIELARERRHHAAMLVGRTLVLAGGVGEASVESIDLDAEPLASVAWESDLGTAIGHASGAAMDGRHALLAGGLATDERVTLSCTFVLDVAKRLVRPGPRLPLERGACGLTLTRHERGMLVLDGEWRAGDERGNANAALLLTGLDGPTLGAHARVWRLPGPDCADALARRMLVVRRDGSVEAVGGYRFIAPDRAAPGEPAGVVVDGSGQRLVVDALPVAD